MPRTAFSSHLASAKSDRWGTPQELVDRLHIEFDLVLDLAAMAATSVCPHYLGPDHEDASCRDALACDWTAAVRSVGSRFSWAFLNPPFSRLSEFMRKVWQERRRGARIVCVVPQKTETVWVPVVAVQLARARSP